MSTIDTAKARGMVQNNFKRTNPPSKEDYCAIWFPLDDFVRLFLDSAVKYPGKRYGIRIYFAKYSDNSDGSSGKSTVVLVNTYSDDKGNNIDIITDREAMPAATVIEAPRGRLDMVIEENEGQGKPPANDDTELLLLEKVVIP